MGSNSHGILCRQWAKIYRTFLVERGRNRSRSHVFPIFDILSHSGDIGDQSQKWYKIARNFACFWPPIFFWGGGSAPRIFGLNLSNRTSFRSCGKVSRRSVEGRRREPCKRKKKHHEHFISPPVTTYGRPKNVHYKCTCSVHVVAFLASPVVAVKNCGILQHAQCTYFACCVDTL